MKSKQNTQTNDTKAYNKFTSGQSLTDFEWSCVLDDNSIENIPKQQHENLEMNAELNEYFKEKEEKEKALMIGLIQHIYEYMSWQQTKEAEAYAAAKAKENNMAEDYRRDEDRFMKDSSTEKGWLENLIKDIFQQQEEQHDYCSFLKSSINAATDDKKNIITNVLHLAVRNEKVRAFIFENPEKHDKTQHCELIMKRIYCVGDALHDIRSNRIFHEHIHTHLKNTENKPQAGSDMPSARRGPH